MRKRLLIKELTEHAFNIILCEESADKHASNLRNAAKSAEKLEKKYLEGRSHLAMRLVSLVNQKKESIGDFKELKNQIRAIAREIFKSQEELDEAIVVIKLDHQHDRQTAVKVAKLFTEGFASKKQID